MTERNYSANAKRTTLSSGIGISDTTVPVADNTATLNYPAAPFTIVVDKGTQSEEIMTVTAVASNSLTVTRAPEGNAATSHSAGATVAHAVTARDFVDAQSHVYDSAAVHGITGSVVGTTDTQTLTNKTISNPTISISSTAAASDFNPRGSIVAYGGGSAPNGWLLCNGTEYDKSGTYALLYNVIGNAYGQTNGSGGAGTSHFRVPNLVGKIPVGHGDNDFGASLGSSGGSKTSTAEHTHTINHGHTGSSGYADMNHGHSASGYANGVGNHAHTAYMADQNFTDGTQVSRTRKGYSATGEATSGSGAHDHSVSVTVNSTGTWNHNHTVTVDSHSGSSGQSSTAVASIGNVQPYVTVNYIIKY